MPVGCRSARRHVRVPKIQVVAVASSDEMTEPHGAALVAGPHDPVGFLVVLEPRLCAYIAPRIVRDADESASVEAGCCTHERKLSTDQQSACRLVLAADADFDVLLATMLDETGGPLTPDERAAARRVLSGGAAA